MDDADGSDAPAGVGGGRCRHASTSDHGRAVPALDRRRLLALGGGLAAASLGGCLGGDGAAPDPVAVEEGQQCDNCGMVIAMHPGPGGEIFYREHSPEGHGNPARFDSLKSCLFPYRMEHERLGWEAAAIYVTDYSAVDYALDEEEGTTYVSRHLGPGSFADATGLHYVVGSDVEGAMGPDFIPFSEAADADAFAADHGGDVVDYGDVDEALVGR